MNRIKKDDEVIVIAGRDKGKRGRVLRVILGNDKKGKTALARKKNVRVRYVIEDINIVKKHVRPNPNKGERGGIIEKPAAIDGSNVMLFNNVTGKGDRVGFKVLEDGRKVRYFKSSGAVVDI